MSADVLTMLSQFGAPGLMIAFLVWDRNKRDALDKVREEANIALAASLTALKVTIENMADRK